MTNAQKKTIKRQAGIVSILAAFFIISAVLFGLSKTGSMTATRGSDARQQINSLATFYAAQSGAELARGGMQAALIDETQFASKCGAVQGTFFLNGIQVVIGGTQNDKDTGKCGVEIKATLNDSPRQAQRLLSYGVDLESVQGGVAGRGDSAKLTLENLDADLTALAIFNFAWRVKSDSSTGDATGGCLSNCVQSWSHWSQNSSGTNVVGSLGAHSRLAGSTTRVAVETKLDSSRSYSYAGLLLKSADKQASVIGSYSDGVRNTATAKPSTGSVRNGTPKNWVSTTANWCERSATSEENSDLLVFGITSLALESPNAPTGKAKEEEVIDVRFNTSRTFTGTTAGVPLKQVAHFPRPQDDSLVNDVYTEVWYYLNPLIDGTVARVDRTQGQLVLSVPEAKRNEWLKNINFHKSTNGKSTYLKNKEDTTTLSNLTVLSATEGSLPTEIVLNIESGSTVLPDNDFDRCTNPNYINEKGQSRNCTRTDCTGAAPVEQCGAPLYKSILTNKKYCGGVCALFNGVNFSDTTGFSVLKSANSTNGQWAGGFVCAYAGQIDEKTIDFVAGQRIISVTWSDLIAD